MKIKINVKEEHITGGHCHNASECAIALAVRDILPQANIFYDSIVIDCDNVIVNNNEMPEDTQVARFTSSMAGDTV